MKRMLTSAAVALSIMAMPGFADAFEAENKVVVTGLTKTTFSVPSAGRFGARGAWCAAADYAVDVLGASGVSRIYVREPLVAPSDPVVFGLTPGAATPVSVSSTSAALRTAGSNLSIDHALQFCHDARLRRGR